MTWGAREYSKSAMDGYALPDILDFYDFILMPMTPLMPPIKE